MKPVPATVLAAAIVLAAQSVQAATVEYRVLVNNVEGSSHLLQPNSTNTLTIQARVTNNTVADLGATGGLKSFGINLDQPGTVLGFTPRPASPSNWNSTINASYATRFRGTLGTNGAQIGDVLSIAGANAGEVDEITGTIAADTFETLASGPFTIGASGSTTLTIDTQDVAFVTGFETSVVQTAANIPNIALSIGVVPEPTSLALVALGGLAMLRRKK